jgi:hypothetical protein
VVWDGGVEVTREGLAAKLAVILPHLDERQRRLLLGAEAQALGHGGIRLVALAAGVSEGVVSRGVAELAAQAAGAAGEMAAGRVRRPGAGRKRAAELDPGLVPALLALVEPEERGDPESPLRWTVKSTRVLAAELAAGGHRVGADTVGDLLRGQGFSLQGNAKTIEGKQHPDRDAQFRYINAQAREYLAAGDPVVSVDAKKKELVGEFANAGRTWRPQGEPAAVRTHDFAVLGTGTAIPYGIYDLAANTGWVNVGTDHNTAGFAVESIRRWWQDIGTATYPHARRLLVTADAGGANGYRTRAWKAGLAALAAQTGLPITVCHFPPGTSKWNKIEHRLFAHIAMNWRGRPLTSHDVIINSIAATTTATGLRVHAALDTSPYPTGIKISDGQLDALPLARHDWHGDWNYTLAPHPASPPPPAPPPRPAPAPPPGLAWLCHSALTGLTTRQWDALTAAITGPAEQLRQAQLHHRRGNRPSQIAPGTGRRPTITLATKLAATILYHRHALPQPAIAALLGIRPEQACRHIGDIRILLAQTGHTITPSPHELTTLHDLCQYATAHSITIPDNINTTS